MLTVGSLFTGIGGIDLAAEWAGMEIIWQCEIDPYCLKVLNKHWPNVRKYGDIRELHAATTHTDKNREPRCSINGLPRQRELVSTDISEKFEGKCPHCLISPDVLVGGFPCQPVRCLRALHE